MISLSIKSKKAQICLDIDCSVSLIDREFIKTYETHYIIRRMTTFLNVRDLSINKHEISKYIIASIYFAETIQEKFVREIIRRKIHLVNDLKTNMLIENDILESEKIFIDDSNSKTIIVSCNKMIISIKIRTLVRKMINKTLHVRIITIISSHSMITISIHSFKLSSNRDFLFESANLDLTMYAHTIDIIIDAIVTKNDFNLVIKISRNARLEIATEILYSNAFLVESHDIANYVERKSRRAHKDSWFFRVLKVAAVAYTAIISMTTQNSDIIFSNDVIIHEFDLVVVFTFKIIVNKFFDLWKSEDFVKLLIEQWMRISLKFDWETRISEKIKIYSLRLKKKKLMNQIFDNLQTKSRLKFTIEFISFNYLVFVVWKTVNEKKKNRVVVDIKDLNFIVLSNAYFLSL
jgi:hypothetical protein